METDLQRWVKSIEEVHWHAIADRQQHGTPDLNGCHYTGVEFWLELKYVLHGNKVTFEPGQVPWLYKRARYGGRAWLLVESFETIYLYSGWQVPTVAEIGLKTPPIAQWRKAAAQTWPKKAVLTALIGPCLRSPV